MRFVTKVEIMTIDSTPKTPTCKKCGSRHMERQLDGAMKCVSCDELYSLSGPRMLRYTGAPPRRRKITRQEAKRWACAHAALLLDSQLAAGWPDTEDFNITDEVQEFLIVAVKELIGELGRRGEKAPTIDGS